METLFTRDPRYTPETYMYGVYEERDQKLARARTVFSDDAIIRAAKAHAIRSEGTNRYKDYDLDVALDILLAATVRREAR